MIEIILVAVCIYLIIQVLEKRNRTETPQDRSQENNPDSVTDGKAEEPELDSDFNTWIMEMNRDIEYRNSEKPELKRNVRVILAMLEKEGIPVKKGKWIHNYFDEVHFRIPEVYSTAGSRIAMARYHIRYTYQPDGSFWHLYANVSVNGEIVYVGPPHREKKEYDPDSLAEELYALKSEVLGIISEKTGTEGHMLSSGIYDKARAYFSVYKDWEVAFDFLHSEEHYPMVPWECISQDFDPESRWKYVQSRYDNW